MAISGTTRTVDLDEANNLNTYMDSSSYSSAVNYTSETSFNTYNSAGIKDGFENAIKNAIDEYISSLNADLNKIETDVEVEQAFQGTDVEKAVNNLLVAVKQEAQNYTATLEEIERNIIGQVAIIYREQTRKVAQEMNADTSVLGGE